MKILLALILGAVLLSPIFITTGNSNQSSNSNSFALINSSPIDVPISTNMHNGGEISQAVDSTTGTIYEAYFLNFSIGFSYSINGGTFFSGNQALPGTYNASAGIYSWSPKISLFSNGTIAIAYIHQYSNGSFSPVVAFSFNGGSTFPDISPVFLTSNNTCSNATNIAISPNGTVYVTWIFNPTGISSSTPQSGYAECSESNNLGETWSTPLKFIVQPSGTFQGYPDNQVISDPIAMNSNGFPMVIAQLSNNDNYFSEKDVGTSGSNWSFPVQVNGGLSVLNSAVWHGGSKGFPDSSICFGTNGTLYSVFETYNYYVLSDPLSLNISCSKDNGKTWTVSPVPLILSNYLITFSMAAGANNSVYILMISNNGTNEYQYLTVYLAGQGKVSNTFQVIKPGIQPVGSYMGCYSGISVFNGYTAGISWGQGNSSYNTSDYFSAMNIYGGRIYESGLPANSNWNTIVNCISRPANKNLSFSTNASFLTYYLPDGRYNISSTIMPNGYSVGSNDSSLIVNNGTFSDILYYSQGFNLENLFGIQVFPVMAVILLISGISYAFMLLVRKPKKGKN